MTPGFGPMDDEVFAELEQSAKSEARTKFDAQSDDADKKLNTEMWKEPRQKRHFRVIMFWSFFLLLLGQYVGLVALVWFMVSNGLSDQLGGTLSIILPATFLETYGIFRIMVQYMFSPSNYNVARKA